MLRSLDLHSKLLVVFAFFMPWSRLLNINTIFLIVLMLLFFNELFKRKFVWPKYDASYSLVFFFFIVLGSIFYSNDIFEGFNEVRVWVFLLLPISLVFKKEITKYEFKTIALFFIISVILASLFLTFDAIMEYKINPVKINKGFAYFTAPLKMHPTYLSIYLIFAFVLYIKLFLNSSKNKKILEFFYWILLLVILLFIRSRAPMLIALILFSIYYYLKLKGLKRYILVGALSLIIIFNWYNFFEFISFERNISTAMTMRFHLWESTIELIKDNFLFGVGVGDFQLEFDKLNFLSGLDQAIDSKYNSHNQYLQIFASTGLLGFTSFISIFYFLIKKQLEFKSFVIFSFIIIASISMMFESILIMLHGVYFFAFFATLLLKIKTFDEEN